MTCGSWSSSLNSELKALIIIARQLGKTEMVNSYYGEKIKRWELNEKCKNCQTYKPGHMIKVLPTKSGEDL
jgi:hypothetical protein